MAPRSSSGSRRKARPRSSGLPTAAPGRPSGNLGHATPRHTQQVSVDHMKRGRWAWLSVYRILLRRMTETSGPGRASEKAAAVRKALGRAGARFDHAGRVSAARSRSQSSAQSWPVTRQRVDLGSRRSFRRHLNAYHPPVSIGFARTRHRIASAVHGEHASLVTSVSGEQRDQSGTVPSSS